MTEEGSSEMHRDTQREKERERRPEVEHENSVNEKCIQSFIMSERKGREKESPEVNRDFRVFFDRYQR